MPRKSDSGPALAPPARLREPARLMTPARLASLQPSRVSASRAMVNRAIRDRWTIRRRQFEIDDRARGTARYSIDIGGWGFTFIVFSFEPRSSGRTDRIIGRDWDMMGALVEGDMTAEEVGQTREELPKLYEGRATPGTLTWARSNRSSRSFDDIVSILAAGRQPDASLFADACYAMRNTGIDANGTFGTRTFLNYEEDHPLRWSLGAQMLSAYMMRVFAVDLLNTLARHAAPNAAELAPEIARFLGLGNVSGLGLVYFVDNHPRLVNQWLSIRELALAEAKPIVPGEEQARTLLRLIDQAIVFRRQDRSSYEAFGASATLAEDLVRVRRALDVLLRAPPGDRRSLGDLCISLDARVSDAALETLHSIVMELVPERADALVDSLALDEELVGTPEMSVRQLRELVADEYAWAFRLDLTSEASQRFVWYKSRTAEEPRRGPREEVPHDAINLGLDLPRHVVRLHEDLAHVDPASSVARFLARYPLHRAVTTRVQALSGSPYHSFAGDMMSEDFIPAHIIHLVNVAFHGIEKAQDYNGRWIRGVLFHGAPLPEELSSGTADAYWFYPTEPAA